MAITPRLVRYGQPTPAAASLDTGSRVQMHIKNGVVEMGVIQHIIIGGVDHYGSSLPVRAIVEWDQRRRGLRRMVPLAKLRRAE